MTRDASLDEFLGESGDDESEEERENGDGTPVADAASAADENAEATADGDAEPEAAVDVEAEPSEGSDGAPAEEPARESGPTQEPEPEAADGPPTPADVEPARSTYTWSPGDAECAACGGTVTERWRDDGQQVCVDCKDWAGTPD